MKILMIGISFFVLCSCMMGSKVMTRDNFEDISIGMTAKELVDKYGKPYSIKNLGDGEVEYEYIEKLHLGTKVVEERHYLIILQNNRVTSKKVRAFNERPIRGNTYEMQTSRNE